MWLLGIAIALKINFLCYMKKFIIIIIFTFLSNYTFSQNEITKANDCYSKKDYECAINNYKISLRKNTYTANQKHIVEYRIGNCLLELEQKNEGFHYLKQCEISKYNYGYGYWKIAGYYYKNKNYDSATYYYKKIINTNIKPEEKEDVLFYLGESLYRNKKYYEAVLEFKKVKNRGVGFENMDAFIGDAYYNLNNYDSSIFYYKKAIELVSREGMIYYNLHLFIGKCYRYKKDFTNALLYLNKANEINPNKGSTIWEIGMVEFDKKDFKSAIVSFKKAEKDYTSDTSNFLILNNNIIRCYDSLKDYNELIKHLKIRTSYTKNNAEDYLRIMKVQYVQLKNDKLLETTYKEFIRDKVNSTYVDYSKTYEAKMLSILASSYLSKKDTTKAISYLRNGINFSSYNYECNQLLGNIFWNRNKKDSAEKYYSKLFKSSYDTTLNSKKDIASVYARNCYFDFFNKQKGAYSISADLKLALKFDSTQKEAIQLWPQIFSTYYTYEKPKIHDVIQNTIDKGIKLYKTDKEYISDLYSSKAYLYSVENRDTLLIKKNLDLAINANSKNMNAWNNLMTYYSKYNNFEGSVKVEKLITILKKENNNKELAKAYVFKGDFLWRLDKKELAKKAYAEALVWDAENKSAKERIKL